uniref:Proctolin n=1 Tax=Carabus violaceus TaxID=41075 RepID=A0A7U3RBQ8_CARVO|nr:proctolin [Carabus violaceus]
MVGSHAMAFLFCFCLASMLILNTEARYLPTRSDRDRLDKLRELLRDLVESELGRAEYPQEIGSSYRSPNEGKIFFKREISAQD